MTTWTGEELEKIKTAEELQFASMRGDGTLRKRVIIWVVRLGDGLYIRPVNGRDGWFRGVAEHHAGRIWAGGVEKDVRFVEVAANDTVNDQIDSEYWSKYSHLSQYVPPVVTAKSRGRNAQIGTALAKITETEKVEEYTKLGNTGLDVSRICLGSMSFGTAEVWFHNQQLQPKSRI